jgi:pyruvate/oxaloacetate carboxyltransferase
MIPRPPKMIHKFTSPTSQFLTVRAVLRILGGYYQTVRRQQKPKYFYGVATSPVCYEVFLQSREIRETFCRLHIQFVN